MRLLDAKTKDFLVACAVLAQRSYEESGTFEVMSRDGRICDERAIVGRLRIDEEDWCTVVIKGTNSTANWVHNLDTDMTDGVHRGFARSNAALKGRGLMDPLFREPKVVAIGHSKGGAQATLLAQDLLRSGKRVRLVTFGAPRPGGQELARELETFRDSGMLQLFRVVHGLDPVPKVPLESKGFKHPDPAISVESALGNVATALDSINGVLEQRQKNNGLTDLGDRLTRFHTISEYIACLRRQQSSSSEPPRGSSDLARVANASLRALSLFADSWNNSPTSSTDVTRRRQDT